MVRRTAYISSVEPGDLDDIVRADREELSAWSAKQFISALVQPSAWQFMARGRNRELKGFIFGRSAADEAEILKLLVAVPFRRQGIAVDLLSYSLDYLRQKDIKCCYLELRSANKAALHLYEKNGFKISGKRKEYYSSPRDDALIMFRVL